MSRSDLKLDSGSTMRYCQLTPAILKGRSTFLYGDTGSGKSTMLDHMLHILKDDLTNCYVLSGSETSNGFFTGKVPSLSIKNSIVNNTAKTLEWLKRTMTHQKEITEMCKKANDIKNLESTFDLCAVGDAAKYKTRQENIMRFTDRILGEIEVEHMHDAAKRKELKNKTKLESETALRKLYMALIALKLKDLKTSGIKLDLNQTVVVEYLFVNPHIGLVIDDCADRFKSWFKMDQEVFKELVYRARHYSMTVLITTQGDKEFNSELRINAYNSIFTSENLAYLNFTRAANGYDANMIREAKRVIPQLFRQTDEKNKHFRKLISSKSFGRDRLRFTVADVIDEPYRIGSPSVWDLNERIEAEFAKKRQESNRLLASLKAKIHD